LQQVTAESSVESRETDLKKTAGEERLKNYNCLNQKKVRGDRKILLKYIHG